MNCNPCCGCLPPITTYNPSVADNFPTILQQVEYLKALLKKYPSQQWFISTEKVTPETVTITTSSIVLHERALQESDFILATSNDDKTTILLFQYVGASSSTLSVVEYVGIFSNQIEAEQALSLAKTKQDKLNDKSDVTVAWLTANGVIADTVKVGDVSDDEDNIYNFPKKAGTFALTADVTATDTKAQQALDLAKTNETDIGTLDGEVAELRGFYTIETLPQAITYDDFSKIQVNSNIVLRFNYDGYYYDYHRVATIGLTLYFVNMTIKDNKIQNFDILSVERNSATTGEIKRITTQDLLNSNSFKTLFGNQSIVGEGNIDLYRHNIKIQKGSGGSPSTLVFLSIVSSSNLKVNSLTDLKQLLNLSDNGFYPANGICETTGIAISINKSQDVLKITSVKGGNLSEYTIVDETITDTVTTI